MSNIFRNYLVFFALIKSRHGRHLRRLKSWILRFKHLISSHIMSHCLDWLNFLLKSLTWILILFTHRSTNDEMKRRKFGTFNHISAFYWFWWKLSKTSCISESERCRYCSSIFSLSSSSVFSMILVCICCCSISFCFALEFARFCWLIASIFCLSTSVANVSRWFVMSWMIFRKSVSSARRNEIVLRWRMDAGLTFKENFVLFLQILSVLSDVRLEDSQHVTFVHEQSLFLQFFCHRRK